MQWFRLYHRVSSDSKVQSLPVEHRWRWVECLCLASQNETRGSLPPLRQIAYTMRVSTAEATAILDSLSDAGLLDRGPSGWFVVHDWDEHQPAWDDAAARMRNHRQTRKATTANTVQFTQISDVTERVAERVTSPVTPQVTQPLRNSGAVEEIRREEEKTTSPLPPLEGGGVVVEAEEVQGDRTSRPSLPSAAEPEAPLPAAPPPAPVAAPPVAPVSAPAPAAPAKRPVTVLPATPDGPPDPAKEPPLPTDDDILTVRTGAHSLTDAEVRKIHTLAWKVSGRAVVCRGFYEHQRRFSADTWQMAFQHVYRAGTDISSINYVLRIATDVEVNPSKYRVAAPPPSQAGVPSNGGAPANVFNPQAYAIYKVDEAYRDGPRKREMAMLERARKRDEARAAAEVRAASIAAKREAIA